MKFKLDHLLAAFGNIKAMERTHVDDFTEKIIEEVDMIPFAISDKNVLYAGTKELGGYFYLKTIIIGAFNIKTMKGATLQVLGKSLDFKLNSDMQEFESDHSNVSNRNITSIDFQLEEDDVIKMDKNKIETLIFKAKKTTIEFKINPD